MATRDPHIGRQPDLAGLIVAAAERAKADFAAAVAPFDLPPHLARAVLVIDEPRPMRSIAHELACDPSHVTGIADDLEARGLATRGPGADRRIKMLELTPRGTALRKRIAGAVGAQPPFGANLDAAQQRALRAMLESILGQE